MIKTHLLFMSQVMKIMMQESLKLDRFDFVKPVSEKLFETCFKSAYEEVYW